MTSHHTHSHSYTSEKRATESRTLIVVIITLLTMVAEITFGIITNSMALLADGWHMGTHAFALGISLFAYIAARKFAHDARFNFGTWKIEILGAYTSAIVLGLAGLMMAGASVERLFNPHPIHYNEALIVAIFGLAINIVCAAILGSVHTHHHEHDHRSDKHEHNHKHKHADLNLKSAYLHVVADALTSVLAIGALCGAKYLAANWLDPVMGLVGAFLITRWSISLLKDSSSILLDRETHDHLTRAIRENIESDNDAKICDLHVWRVAEHKYTCIISLTAKEPHPIEVYRGRIEEIHELVHVTIEARRCG